MAHICFKNTLEDISEFKEIDESILTIACAKYASTNEELYSLVMDQKVVIYKNNEYVKVDDWSSTDICEDDYIVITPEIGNSDQTGAFVKIAIGAMLLYVALHLGPGASPVWTYLLASFGSSLIMGGVTTLFTDYDMPSYRYSSTESSQTYNWSGISSGARTDIPVPVLYGSHRIGGNVIAVYTQQEGRYDYLYVLLGLCEGEIEGIYNYNTEQDEVYRYTDTKIVGNIPDIEVDNQPIRNYSNWECWWRKGRNTQTVIPGFQNTQLEYSVGQEVPVTGYVYTTQAEIDGLRIETSAPALYTVDGSDVLPYSITYKIEYKYEASSVDAYKLAPIERYGINYDAITVASGARLGDIEVVSYKYEQTYQYVTATPLGIKLEITGNTFDPNKIVWIDLADLGSVIPVSQTYEISYDLYDSNNVFLESGSVTNQCNVDRIFNADHTKLLGWDITHSYTQFSAYIYDIKLGHEVAEDNVFRVNSELVGTYGEVTLTERTKDGVKSSVELDFIDLGLTKNQYDIRISRTDNGSSDDWSTSNALYLDSITEIVYGEYTYPNTALLGLKIRADGQLSGNIPNITTKVKGKTVKVPDIAATSFDDYYYNATTNRFHEIDNPSASRLWDGTSYTTTLEHTANPMLCVRDFVINKRYGLGNYISKNDLYTADVAIAVKECHKWDSITDSHMHEYDGILEQQQSGLGLLLEMCNSFRCWPIWYNGKLGFRIDRDDTPIQTIAQSNMQEFSQTWTPLSDLPYKLYGQFTSEENNYDMRSLMALSNDENLTKVNSNVIGLKGITNYKRASRELKFKLNKVLNCTHGINFKCGLDAMHTSAGDIVYVQNDLPQWGYGGRVTTYTKSTKNIVLDKDYNVSSTSLSYTVRFQNDENSLLVATLTNLTATGLQRSFTLESHVGTPCNDSVITIGKSGEEPKKFRLLSVKRDKDNTVECFALEHLSSLYSAQDVVVIDDDYSGAPNPLAIPGKPRIVSIEPVQNGFGFYIKALPPSGASGITNIVVQMEDISESTNVSPVISVSGTIAPVYAYKTIGQLSAPNWEMRYTDNSLVPNRDYFFKLYCTTRVKTGDYIVVKARFTQDDYNIYAPNGIHIVGKSPNVHTFLGKSVKIAWNPIGLSADQSYTIKGYSVEVHHLNNVTDELTTATLKNTYFVGSEEFEYTFDENLSNSDNTVFGDSIVGFRINTETINGAVSSWGVPFTVYNTTPSNVVISSYGTSHGARFSWVSTDETDDLAYYLYRVKVGSGAYSSWDDTRDSVFERILTQAEIDAADANVTIQVKAVDKFGQESTAVSETINATEALSTAGFTINSTDGFYIGTGATRIQLKPSTGIWCGATAFGDAPFSVSNAGALKATSATITGTVTANSGSIGGWDLTASTLSSATITLDSANDKITVGAAGYIESTNYVSGVVGTGFHIDSNLLEVGNIACRGIIRTAVFQKDVVSVVGGNLLVTPGDVLATDMTAADSSTLEIEGNETFSVGDILRIKDGTDDEWLTVSGVGSAPVYSVNRDRGTDYAANSNPAWKKGATVTNYRQNGDGGIFITSSESNAPYVAVFTHNGTPWSATTTLVRMGNLNGFLGYSSDIFGFAVGTSTEYVKIDPTNGIQISSAKPSAMTILSGGDITLVGGATPGKVIFDGTSYVAELFMDNSDNFWVNPQTDDAIDVYFGGSGHNYWQNFSVSTKSGSGTAGVSFSAKNTTTVDKEGSFYILNTDTVSSGHFGTLYNSSYPVTVGLESTSTTGILTLSAYTSIYLKTGSSPTTAVTIDNSQLITLNLNNDLKFTAAQATGTKSVAAGFISVTIGGTPLFIQTYSS